jgi:hypothetical protein
MWSHERTTSAAEDIAKRSRIDAAAAADAATNTSNDINASHRIVVIHNPPLPAFSAFSVFSVFDGGTLFSRQQPQPEQQPQQQHQHHVASVSNVAAAVCAPVAVASAAVGVVIVVAVVRFVVAVVQASNSPTWGGCGPGGCVEDGQNITSPLGPPQ